MASIEEQLHVRQTSHSLHKPYPDDAINMAEQARAIVITDSPGETLVRRFTEELDGDDNLEDATIAAQAHHDNAIRNEEDMRIRKLYEDADAPS